MILQIYICGLYEYILFPGIFFCIFVTEPESSLDLKQLAACGRRLRQAELWWTSAAVWAGAGIFVKKFFCKTEIFENLAKNIILISLTKMTVS